MTIRLRRHGEGASGAQTPHAILLGRLDLAADMLRLAVAGETTLPTGHVDALKEVLRRVERVRTWCACHPPEGESL